MKGTKQATSGTLSRSAPARGKFRKICLALLLLVTAALFGFAPQAWAENWIDYADTGWYDSADEWDGIGYRTYEISTAEELAGLAKLVNEGTENFESQIIRLTADIDLAGKDWTPIGLVNPNLPTITENDGSVNQVLSPQGDFFAGRFYGNGHKIKGLRIDLDENYLGLFSVMIDQNAEIRDIVIEDGEVRGVSSCGLIVGHAAFSTIKNCSVSGAVLPAQKHMPEFPEKPDKNSSGSYLPIDSFSRFGGVAGVAMKVHNCHADVTIEGFHTLGGIVGKGLVYSSTAKGTVTSTLTYEQAFYTISDNNTNSYHGDEPCAKSEITKSTYSDIGGILGNGNAANCRSEVTVLAPNVAYVGGISGKGAVANSVSLANVTGAYYVGGIVGQSYDINYGKGIANCYSSGEITAQSAIKKAYWRKDDAGNYIPIGEEDGAGHDYEIYLGGIAGSGSGDIVNCATTCLFLAPEMVGRTYYYYLGSIAGHWIFSDDDGGEKVCNLAWQNPELPAFTAAFGRLEYITHNNARVDATYYYVDDPTASRWSFMADEEEKIYVTKLDDYMNLPERKAELRDDMSDLIMAVVPAEGIVYASKPEFNFVGYPNNNVSANFTVEAKTKDSNVSVKVDGAKLSLTGLKADDYTDLQYRLTVKATDVTNSANTVGEDYWMSIGSTTGTGYSISPIVAAASKVFNFGLKGQYPNVFILAVHPGGEEPQPSGVEKVTLDRTEVSLEPAGWVVLKAAVWPNGASQTVKWSSSDTNIAVVDANGFVTAKAGAGGIATIRATSAEDESKYAECVVTVAPMAAPEATTPRIDDSVAISDDIDVIATAEAFTNTEEAAEAISSDIALEQQEENGPVYPTQDAAEAAVKASLAEDETLAESVYRLPVFSVSTSSPTAAAAWIVKGYALLADKIEDVDIRKIISGKEAAKFIYKAADFTDGSFTILKMDGTLASGTITNKEEEFQILLFIADNGSFDLNKEEGMIADPAVIVRTSKTEPAPEPEPTPSGGGGSGGCSAGWGALALLAVVPLFARRKK